MEGRGASSWIQNPGAHRREKRTLLISGPCRLLIHWPGTGGWEDTKICVSSLWLSGCKNALQVQACIWKNVRKEADLLTIFHPLGLCLLGLETFLAQRLVALPCSLHVCAQQPSVKINREGWNISFRFHPLPQIGKKKRAKRNQRGMKAGSGAGLHSWLGAQSLVDCRERELRAPSPHTLIVWLDFPGCFLSPLSYQERKLWAALTLIKIYQPETKPGSWCVRDIMFCSFFSIFLKIQLKHHDLQLFIVEF